MKYELACPVCGTDCATTGFECDSPWREHGAIAMERAAIDPLASLILSNSNWGHALLNWVFSEVIPEIARTGAYRSAAQPQHLIFIEKLKSASHED